MSFGEQMGCRVCGNPLRDVACGEWSIARSRLSALGIVVEAKLEDSEVVLEIELESADEYLAVLTMLHGLLDLDPQPGSAVADRCRILAELLGAYEKKNFEKLTEEMS